MKQQPMFRRGPCPHCGQSMRMINGLHLRDLRTQAGLTQRKFGKLLGVTSPYVSDWERNRRTPSADVIEVYRGLKRGR